MPNSVDFYKGILLLVILVCIIVPRFIEMGIKKMRLKLQQMNVDIFLSQILLESDYLF